MARCEILFTFSYKKCSPTLQNICSSLFIIIISLYCISITDCRQIVCHNGHMKNDTCVCDPGWIGSSCTHCSGRVRYTNKTGFITDGTGNYSLNSKCSWIIDSGQSDTPIHFHFSKFETECGWDHIHIYDGDSVFSPLIAALSGFIPVQNASENNSVRELTARSGRVFIHFYSDIAYNMSGFNISYSIGNCSHPCFVHGTCVSSKCVCDTGWTGNACDQETCLNNCSGNGECHLPHGCLCKEGFQGNDCSTSAKYSVWQDVWSASVMRASHQSIVIGDEMWIIGGYSFTEETTEFIVKYSFKNQNWHEIVSSNVLQPTQRYGHSVVKYKDDLYMYGGVISNKITNELWVFHISTSRWEQLKSASTQSSSLPIAVAGHSAFVVNNTMYIVFGHSPVYGFVNHIQEYNLENGRWSETFGKGALVNGSYGHSLVYDPDTNQFFIFGGYISTSHSSYTLSDSLYSYDITANSWTVLRKSGYFRYLHSAVLIGTRMLVYGGNTHNDSNVSHGAKCFSQDFLIYDTKCNTWSLANSPSVQQESSRFGHSAVLYNHSMYIYGGFNGFILNSMIKFIPGNCQYYNTSTGCVNANIGVECVWSKEDDYCYEKSSVATRDKTLIAKDCDPSEGSKAFCPTLKECPSCLSSSFSCNWCGANCTNATCNLKPVQCSLEGYLKYTEYGCSSIHNCFACVSVPDYACQWDNITNKCHSARFAQDVNKLDSGICPPPCHKFSSCENCTVAVSCMWCSNLKQCIPSNSYVSSFPYGQCKSWTNSQSSCPATRCKDLKSCDDCQTNPSCGWCNDPSDTGVGKCIEGSLSGAIITNSTGNYLNPDTCPAERWYFLGCPLCQCNGHSTCKNGTGICKECQNLTEGPNCQRCVNGYYGDPRNGKNCSACACNGQADSCNQASGECYCRARGVVGTNCDKCEDNYTGNPRNGGYCYYNLITDYQFTFNLSKKEDSYYTQINFLNIPSSDDRDVDFTLNCSKEAYLNISVRSRSQPEERMLITNHKCEYFRAKFSHKDHAFGPKENTTFMVYLYDFSTPFWLQISFVQHEKFPWLLFVIIFASCFLSLLLIALVLWKIKHKYDNYRRRQNIIVEMERMASRPFATANLELDKKCLIDPADAADEKEKKVPPDQKKKKTLGKNNTLNEKKMSFFRPGLVAREPLHGNKAAVVSVILQLPTGGEEFTASGQSGIAIASTVVTLLHPRKQSLDITKSGKSKFRKPHHHLSTDTCV